jgi:Mg2+/Co2+ transporter CorB
LYNNSIKTIIIIVLLLPLLVGFLLSVVPILQDVFAQVMGLDQMISQMRFSHSQLLGIDQIKQSVQSNNTSEALNLLDDMDVKVDQMNGMFNDLVWGFSNRGH